MANPVGRTVGSKNIDEQTKLKMLQRYFVDHATLEEISKEFKVSKNAIGYHVKKIKKLYEAKIASAIADPAFTELQPPVQKGFTPEHLTSVEIASIKKSYEAGASPLVLAQRYGVGIGTINHHINAATHRQLQPSTDKLDIITKPPTVVAPYSPVVHPASTPYDVKAVKHSKRRYQTDLLYLAAYLAYHYHRLIDVQPLPNSNRVLFVFDETQELQDHVLKFHNDEATVEPKRYQHNLRTLKNKQYDTPSSRW